MIDVGKPNSYGDCSYLALALLSILFFMASFYITHIVQSSHMHSEQDDKIKKNNEEAPLCSLTMLRARPWLKSRKIATINFILNLPQLPKRMKTAQLTFRFPQPPSCLPQCWSARHYLAPLEVRLPPSLLSRAAQRHRAGIIIAPHFEIDDLEASV